MSEVVERNCHAGVGGHVAEWALHDDGTWHATYGPHSEAGSADGADQARQAAEGWVNTMHKAYTGQHLPPTD